VRTAIRIAWLDPGSGALLLVLGETQYRHGALGARLRAARTSEGVTPEEAAAICKVPVWEYLSFETGKRLIPSVCLLALEAVKGLDRDWIVTGATDAEALLMLPDDRLVETWTSQKPPADQVDKKAAEIRQLIAHRTRSDRTWGASLDLFLEPPAKMVMRDKIQSAAEFAFRAGAFAFIAQFGVMLVMMVGIAAAGLDISPYSGLMAFSMAVWMLIIGLAMIVSIYCQAQEKREGLTHTTIPIPQALDKKS
jgi:transcriptional regulator with XRE-family HTH domain